MRKQNRHPNFGGVSIYNVRMSNSVWNQPEFYSRSSVLQYRLKIKYTCISRLICFLFSAYFLVLISRFYQISFFFFFYCYYSYQSVNYSDEHIFWKFPVYINESKNVLLRIERTAKGRGVGENGGIRERPLTENGGGGFQSSHSLKNKGILKLKITNERIFYKTGVFWSSPGRKGGVLRSGPGQKWGAFLAAHTLIG